MEKMKKQEQQQAKNSEGDTKEPFSKLAIKNQDVILFPAYPEGKFYKNNED